MPRKGCDEMSLGVQFSNTNQATGLALLPPKFEWFEMLDTAMLLQTPSTSKSIHDNHEYSAKQKDALDDRAFSIQKL